MKHLLNFGLLTLSLSAFAGPSISGGGTAPTPYIFDKTALRTILDDVKVNASLANAGSIKSILPENRNWVITTEKCVLTVKFLYARRGDTPYMDFSAEIVSKVGACEK